MSQIAQLPSYESFEGYGTPPPLESWPQEPLPSDAWTHQLLPDGLIFDNYLASTKESRLALHLFSVENDGTLFDGILGARIGIWRYGTTDAFRPEGWQLDVEGSGQVRLDLPEERDVRSVDFRAGIPITYGVGAHRVKFGYYHLSSHVGDEFLLKNPGFNRQNYSRDALVLGYSYYIKPQLRAYGEVGWAFYYDICDAWEFQFGLDYAPCGYTGLRGAPFCAVNAHLRQEVNYGGAFTFEAGWAWRGEQANMLRTGLFYLNGKTNQYSFYDDHEEQIGFGLWYDF
ncbi:MAG: DUF1207 domain-containing protein [Planctomycetaceae bacterium]|nr:DUF1207 domain-containing protein [Planctomycetaceae bacterium]MCB9940835.1 DUF1207 domain-containing protein [Planctomycetaceae bacterium]